MASSGWSVGRWPRTGRGIGMDPVFCFLFPFHCWLRIPGNWVHHKITCGSQNVSCLTMTGHTNISGSSKNIEYWFKCDFKATWFWVLYCVEGQLFIQRNAKFFSTEQCVKSITMLYVFLMEECIVRILRPVDLCWCLEMEWIGPLYTLHDFLDKHMHFLKGIVCCRIGGALCWSNYFPSLFIDMNWCLLKVHILKLLLIFQNSATLFAKGCCIHWGMVFFKVNLQVLFANLFFPSLFIENILHGLVPVSTAHFLK